MYGDKLIAIIINNNYFNDQQNYFQIYLIKFLDKF